VTPLRRTAPGSAHHRVSRDRWLVSYADFVTLLFAFFATLYAASRVDAHRMTAMAEALQNAFVRTPVARGVVPSKAMLDAQKAEQSNAEIEQIVSRDLTSELDSERLKLFVDHRGVTLSIPEAGTFGVGRDELSAAARELIGRVGRTLERFPNAVRVEGHTDDVPIHNARFASNWDLSAARASRVVELLIDQGLVSGRFSVTGYGEFRPRTPNSSPDSRASNRRVDLVILNSVASAAEPPATAVADAFKIQR
jgi:chemotaxis protein MotB